MSAITTQKELLKTLLVAAGVGQERVALQTEKKEQIEAANLLPWAAIISDTARFEGAERREVQLPGPARLYKQLRCKVVQPFVVQVFDQDETLCTGLIERLIASMPHNWDYKGLQGLIDLKHCQHSDFYSAVCGCYESALLLEFTMDLGPDAQQGKRIQVVDVE